MIPGWQCYWRVKTEGAFSPDKTPIMVHEQPVSEGYEFRYSFPEDEFPGLIKVLYPLFRFLLNLQAFRNLVSANIRDQNMSEKIYYQS